MGISGKFRLQKKGKIEIKDASFDAGRQWLFEIRRKIRGIFQSILERDAEKAGIFSAIVLGDRSQVESDVKSLYQKNGIAHILAVSGLHISLIGMGLFKILRKQFYVPVSALLSGSVMVLFCILSGGSASAIRATTMFLLRMTAAMRGKTFDLLTGLSFAGLLLLLTNPLYLTNSAFLLSFGAILGLALPGHAAEGLLSLQNSAVKAFFASLSVFLMTAPILMSVYYEISLFSILLNLAVIPLMSLILGSGIMGGISGLLSLALARFAIGLGTYLLSFVEILCRILDYLPFLVFITGKPSAARVILFYSLLFGGTAVWSWWARKERAGISFFRNKMKQWKRRCFAGWVLLLLFVLFLRFPHRSLQITFLDVDQGDGILLEMPSGEVCLIDGGSSSIADVGTRRMESALKYYGISEIDYAFVSHTDSDHFSGMLELMEESGAGSIRIRHLCLPVFEDNENQTLLLTMARERGIPVTFLSSGMTYSFGEVRLTCLHPASGRSYSSANTASAVLSLTYGSFSALFTGDLEAEGEQELIHRFSSMDHDLLKVGHHGSRDASSSAFLEAVSPQLAVISAGVKNQYGHPHKEVLERLNACGAKIYLTAEKGQIQVKVDRSGAMTVQSMF
jgi:competence protein ComEC